MPNTTFRLLHRGGSLDVDLPAFQSMLPSSMTVVHREDACYIEVQTAKEEDPSAQFHVDRELDRLFFLTCVRVEAEMCRRTGSAEFVVAWSVHGPIPSGTKRQHWSYALGVQLRLWSLACAATDPFAKIVLLYQIIELSNPSFPPYTDATKAPAPLTECKLLRHLVVHSGDVGGGELKTYCSYLGLPPVMLDRTDSSYVELLSRKWKLVEKQAEHVLQRAL